MDSLPAVREEVLEGVIDQECQVYCSHGGYCVQNYGHEGQHDSGYCKWDDKDSLSKAEADEVLASKPGGEEVLIFESMFGR